MIIIGCVLAIIIIICVTWYFRCYCKYKEECVGKISFKKFLEVYENAEHKVSLWKGRFKYYPGSTMFDNGYFLYFSILDTFRYERFRKNVGRREQAEQNSRKMEKVEQG